MKLFQFQSGNLGQHQNVPHQGQYWVTGNHGTNVIVNPDFKPGAENAFRNTQIQPALIHLNRKLSNAHAISQHSSSPATFNYEKVVSWTVKSTLRLQEVPFSGDNPVARFHHVCPSITTKSPKNMNSTRMSPESTWTTLKLKNNGHILFELRFNACED